MIEQTFFQSNINLNRMGTTVFCIVADPHHVDAYPDPAGHFDATGSYLSL
jgi:hypothetical protein